MSKTIAIDFDGVIHKYSKGWQDGSIYDEPVDNVFQTIQDLMGKGYSVFIFSTRSPRQIKRWLMPLCYNSDYVQMGPGNDPYDYIWPKFGFEVEVIPWWKTLFGKTFFWNKKNVLGITNHKLPAMCYIDDRSLRFNGDWLQTTQDVDSFRTYQEQEVFEKKWEQSNEQMGKILDDIRDRDRADRLTNPNYGNPRR